jgi:hypothetical protein
MSRKSAYALKSRDPAFAKAWEAALKAERAKTRQGDKMQEVEDPPVSSGRGDMRCRESEAATRDRFFARLAANRLVQPSFSRTQVAPCSADQ